MNQNKILLLEGFQNDILMSARHLETNILKKMNEILIPLFEKGWTILYAVHFNIHSTEFLSQNKKKECILGSHGAHLASGLFVPSVQLDKQDQCYYVPYALDQTQKSNNVFFHSANNKDPTVLRRILKKKKCSHLMLCGLNETVLQETLSTAKQELNIQNMNYVVISNEDDIESLRKILTNL